eukprot:5713107-Amphidinium_carterae.2
MSVAGGSSSSSSNLYSDSLGSAGSRVFGQTTPTFRLEFFQGTATRVCHTSTIPLSCSMNMTYVRRRRGGVRFDNCERKHFCQAENCCFNSMGQIEVQKTFCSCTKLPQVAARMESAEFTIDEDDNVHCPEEVFLENACFLEVLPRMDEEEFWATICFCPDKCSIMDETYDSVVQLMTSHSGWAFLEKSAHLRTLQNSFIKHTLPLLDWFYVHDTELCLTELCYEMIEASSFERFVLCCKQIFITMNGVVILNLLSNPKAGYTFPFLMYWYARCFKKLLRKYILPNVASELYRDFKLISSWIKPRFIHVDYNTRMQMFDLPLQTELAKELMKPILLFLRCKVLFEEADKRIDFTMSQEWLASVSVLTQTRCLGYTPAELAASIRIKYRMAITKDVPSPSPEEVRGLYVALVESLRNHEIPEMTLSEAFRRGGLMGMQSPMFVKEREALNRIINVAVSDVGVEKRQVVPMCLPQMREDVPRIAD